MEKKKPGPVSKKPPILEFEKLNSEMKNVEMAKHYGVSLPTIARWKRELLEEETKKIEETKKKKKFIFFRK